MEARKTIKIKEEGDYIYNKIHIIKEPIAQDIFDDICDWIGEANNYESVIFYDIFDNYFFDVDDVIEYLNENIIAEKDYREDFEIDKANKYVKLLSQFKGYYIYN